MCWEAQVLYINVYVGSWFCLRRFFSWPRDSNVDLMHCSCFCEGQINPQALVQSLLSSPRNLQPEKYHKIVPKVKTLFLGDLVKTARK